MAKRMVIFRGVPGSGKSTYQREHYPMAYVASSDHFFTVEGEYRFDYQRLQEAHRWCFRQVLTAITRDEPLIVVDNTNTRAVDVAPYAVLGEAFDYEILILRFLVDPIVAAARNIHGVPEDSVVKMSRRLEMEVLPPWWPQDVVYDESMSKLYEGWREMGSP